jgi:inorganic pyrophosphatase
MSDLIKVCIQTTAGSYERKVYNEKTLELLGTRRSRIAIPYSYGFILNTNSPDGGNLDCYVVTRETLVSGDIIDCEPVAMLVQFEGEEVETKIIATLPGETPVIDDTFHQALSDYITASFAAYPEISVRLGPVLSRQAALEQIQAARAEAA